LCTTTWSNIYRTHISINKTAKESYGKELREKAYRDLVGGIMMLGFLFMLPQVIVCYCLWIHWSIWLGIEMTFLVRVESSFSQKRRGRYGEANDGAQERMDTNRLLAWCYHSKWYTVRTQIITSTQFASNAKLMLIWQFKMWELARHLNCQHKIYNIKLDLWISSILEFWRMAY